jgi:hypothetical protein
MSVVKYHEYSYIDIFLPLKFTQGIVLDVFLVLYLCL